MLEAEQQASETTIAHLKQMGSSISDDVFNEIHNYPKTAWKKLAENNGIATTAGEYVDRKDGADRPIPHICFKIPTGGGNRHFSIGFQRARISRNIRTVE